MGLGSRFEFEVRIRAYLNDSIGKFLLQSVPQLHHSVGVRHAAVVDGELKHQGHILGPGGGDAVHGGETE